MDIEFVLTHNDLDQDKQNLIEKTLRLNQGELNENLNKIAKAATAEYISMLIEGGMPNRADESKQDRLFHLIANYFEQSLPNESQISTIFQLTQSQSKTLLKNTVSRYRHKLDISLQATMRAVVESAGHAEDKYLVVISSDVVKDELNMLITQNEPTYKPITKRKGSASQYEISEDSHELLCQVLGIHE